MPVSGAATQPTFVVAAVCVRDDRGRVLMVRKRGTEGLMLPGGKIEPGEDAATTARRELHEELGVELRGLRPLGRYRAAAANEPGATVRSTVFTAEVVGEPEARAEIDLVVWVDPEEAPAHVAPLTREHVLPALRGRVRVVGIGADGWDGLGVAAREAVLGAPVVVGGPRHLDLLPAVPGQQRLTWPRPFDVGVVERHPGCVVVASGDPLVSGVGTTLVRRLGADRVEVLPAVSSVALARARLGWDAETTAVLTTVGRDLEPVLRELAPGRRLLVLTSDASSPEALAALLTEHGWGDSTLTVLGDLGAATESRRTGPAATWAATWAGASPALHVVAVEAARSAEPGSALGWAAGLPDTAYEHDGQLTKRDVRASALARLQPRPGELLWDVGAGAGSVAIEWLRAHPTCAAHAVERDPERAARIARNARRLGVPGLVVVEGTSPEALRDLPEPDAVFVGGGATVPGVLDACRERLRPGGRLVVHGVTLQTEQLLAAAYETHGGELTRLAVETAAPVGTFTGWTPARAVTQWAWSKP